MPQQVSDINIQKDILKLLDKVVQTGVPLEIERKGKRLLISPAKKHRDLDCLENHQDFVVGNPNYDLSRHTCCSLALSAQRRRAK